MCVFSFSNIGSASSKRLSDVRIRLLLPELDLAGALRALRQGMGWWPQGPSGHIWRWKDPAFWMGKSTFSMPCSISETVNVYQRVPGKMTSQLISRCPGVTINWLPSSKNSLEVELSIGTQSSNYCWGIFQQAMELPEGMVKVKTC